MNVTEESNRSKYLIIARVGDSSLHPSWLEPKEFRSFDLCLSYYGEQSGRYASDCNYYTAAGGDKWPVIKTIVQGFGKDIEQYEAIWIPDERINTNAFNLNEMFHIFRDQELWLAQPALTEDSYTPYPALIHHPEFILRYMRFGEMPAPIFTPEALKACAAAMDANPSLQGFIWPKELPYPNRPTAVIDVTPVKQPNEPLPASEQEPVQEIHETVNMEVPQQTQNDEASKGEHETPPLLIRKTGRAGRSGRSRRFRRARKKTKLKQKFLKKQKLKKAKKAKPARKLKKHKWKVKTNPMKKNAA